jgi:hypothetical protein
MTVAETECRARVVVLGASNVERGIATVVSVARNVFPGPIEYFLACGHGRSYGMESSVLGRRLPGIAPCELWPALADRPPLPTVAVLTDIGNDLLYGVPVERIARWVEECVARLCAADARVAIAGLPLGALETLQPWRFALLSRMFFPLHAVRFESLRADALALDAALREIAARHATGWIAPSAEWYGFDPIHVRRRVSAVAWEKFFRAAHSGDDARFDAPRTSFREWLRLKRWRPLRRRLWGIEQLQQQPVGMLRDGSRVWLY